LLRRLGEGRDRLGRGLTPSHHAGVVVARMTSRRDPGVAAMLIDDIRGMCSSPRRRRRVSRAARRER
jgi:hypothetical protein